MTISGLDLLEIDGLDLRTYAYNVSTRTGRYHVPGLRGEDVVLPGRSGYLHVPNKPYEPGEGTLSVWCNATNPATGLVPTTKTARRTQFETNMMTLQRIFTRQHRLSLMRAGQPDGTVRRAYVQWTGWDEPEIQAQSTMASFQIHYTIPAVFWEDESTTSQSSASGSSLPKTLDLSSFAGMSGVIEDAVLTVAGSITNPRITDMESGAWIQYTGTVSAGSSWVIDVGAATSTIGGSSVMANTTHVGGYRLLVIPNIYNNATTPRLQLSGSGGGSATSLNVVARRKWVSG